MADPITWAIIGGSLIVAGIGAATTFGAQAIEQEAQDKTRAEEKLQLISELRGKADVAKAELGSISGVMPEEMSAAGREAGSVLSKEKAEYAFGGAELTGGSPLLMMTRTALQAQSDVNYLADYYAAQLAAKQAEITAYYQQIKLLGGWVPPTGTPTAGGGGKSGTPVGTGAGGLKNPQGPTTPGWHKPPSIGYIPRR
jgi:hypothetical protein